MLYIESSGEIVLSGLLITTEYKQYNYKLIK